ncbi:hypothetical protein GFD17_03060 [Bifidobacterium sp. SMB2]|uniref:Uncharacterized protein n=1 Tax=Bifidobacterium saimiriisciurei TaxID=2661627 RepID=A0ABX0CFQ8_9BIFI|nr:MULTISPECIES: hypothetical protein [Bifidobacterium]NEG95750.1 hypothetical protein [Bifidobacterium sp. SMB2]NEH11177.1 hypothetical protein [Bifidobacterium saimiriisciurei]
MFYALITVLTIAAFLIGMLMASLPRSARMMSRAQLIVMLFLTILLIGVLAATYMFHSEPASWAIIIAAFAGNIIGRLRPVNEFIVGHDPWDLFALR